MALAAKASFPNEFYSLRMTSLRLWHRHPLRVSFVLRLLLVLPCVFLTTVAQVAPPPTAVPPAAPATPPTPVGPEPLPLNEDIQVSFQGANIDLVVQWLSQTTGKSVVKHPQAQCQLTITSSKKLPLRDAIDLVYRALSLEGFNAVESGNSIFIVPEGKEPRMSPELIDASRSDIPAGRQKLVKIFQLKSRSRRRDEREA